MSRLFSAVALFVSLVTYPSFAGDHSFVPVGTPVDISTSQVTGVLSVANGGTGDSSYPTGVLLFGNGTTKLISDEGPMSEGELIIGDGALFPAIVAMSGDGTLASSGALTVDSTLRTHSVCDRIVNPVSDADFDSVWRAPIALTITEIWCETDAGTSGLELTSDDGAVNGSDISCAVSTGTSDTSFAGDANIAQNHVIDINVGTVATAARLSVCWRYTVD